MLVNTVKSQSVQTYTTNTSPVNQLSPNFIFDSLLNYKKEKLALADWKGKPVIIDFWGTFCLPCITEIPKLENFKKRFGDSLQVLLVATDGIEKATQLYETRKKANKPIGLPCTASREAQDYFQVKVVSSYVWIDDQGYVKAITDDSQLTEQNIAAFVNRKEVHLQEIEKKSAYDKRYLVTIASEIDSNNVLFHSSLTKYLNGQWGSYGYPPKGVGTHLKATNSSVNTLYRMAFGDSMGIVPLNRLVIESAHPEKFQMPRSANFNEWKNENAFCYELTVPKDRQQDILKIMQDDLKKMFGATVFFENRIQKCLVLTADKNARLMADKSETPKVIYNGGGSTVINQPFSELVEMIHHYNQDKILFDETGITGKVSVAIQAQMNDIEALNEALKKYGLSIHYEDRNVRMFIMKDPVK